MMRLLCVISCLLTASFLGGQDLPNRYLEPIFTQVDETSQVLFSSQVPQPRPGGGFYEWLTGYPLNADESDLQNVDLYMDIFEPSGDTLDQRPLIILCFGGGFLSGSKDHWSIRLLAQELAKRGFVTATIDYRLGMNIFDRFLAMRAVYRGVQDGRSAVRFFRADADNANTYRINPNHIYMGGHSSGAFIALHNLYMDKDSERPASTRAWYHNGWLADQDSLDNVGNNTNYDGLANGAFALAGALGYTSYIEGGESGRVVLFHSSDDGTVPFHYGTPFSSILWAVVGDDLPPVHGSNRIAERMDSLVLHHAFNAYTNRGHGVHEETNATLYSDILPEISNWFYSQYFLPDTLQIEQDSFICDTTKTYTYSVNGNNARHIDWHLDNGHFTNTDTSGLEVSVRWDSGLAPRQLSVTPYSDVLARGFQTSNSILLEEGRQVSWIGASGDWENELNWDQGILPDVCDDVYINSLGNPILVSLSNDIIINSLHVSNDVQLLLNTQAWLKLRED